MECESKVSLCFFAKQRSWISTVISLLSLLIFVGYFLGFGFFSPVIFLTSTVLILSTTLFTLSYKPIKLVPKDQIIEPLMPSQSLEEKQAQEEDEQQEMIGSSTDSQDSLSESDCVDFSDDGSISDEESLIEIALPSGYVDDHKKKTGEFFPQCIFEQRSIMELLAEINDIILEEDNLIEIDISIGSIKCSRFEIEA